MGTLSNDIEQVLAKFSSVFAWNSLLWTYRLHACNIFLRCNFSQDDLRSNLHTRTVNSFSFVLESRWTLDPWLVLSEREPTLTY